MWSPIGELATMFITNNIRTSFAFQLRIDEWEIIKEFLSLFSVQFNTLVFNLNFILVSFNNKKENNKVWPYNLFGWVNKPNGFNTP